MLQLLPPARTHARTPASWDQDRGMGELRKGSDFDPRYEMLNV